ncbi:MAG: hypothetical protein HY788_15780 [Deltaproteobacteria bacterium]|nr:hypothetical protein [Deltaproteobacteria bacterium]
MHATSIVFDSPFGAIGLTATEVGLSHIVFRAEQEPVQTKTMSEASSETAPSELSTILREARIQILEYFEGTRRTFDLELDLN